ncbi:TIGR02444 family protein [Amphritea opalescens]|uniref:TIGR02444 family protein n=1 Tax=Amphritea opalescens TaxID=2490544 RepID=A0A430KLU9_9GAMM|nr:TIGR02444 family protein [Amphritea opalescens]RTE64436.1 TIGR02444 family protein [Amphritea opalescens]
MLDNNVFWHFAVQIYSTPEVADLCLTLQNRYQLSVNDLLFGLWLAREGKQLPPQLDDQQVQQWRSRTLEPLRKLRYDLRQSKQSEDQQCCYEAMKQAELSAEKVEIGLLYDLRDLCPDAAGADVKPLNQLSYLNLCVAAKVTAKTAENLGDLPALLRQLSDKAAGAVVIG